VQILTLPEMLTRAEVPKLRVVADDPQDVLNLYNRLQNPALGQWHYEYENPSPSSTPTNMNVLTLVPDKSVIANRIERNGTKVKAIALGGVPESKWEALAKDINDARKYGAEAVAEKGGNDVFSGSIHFQKESKVLIISGSENYVEMVDSLVTAHRMNAELEMKEASKPTPPPTNP
jgi:capsid portal protein